MTSDDSFEIAIFVFPLINTISCLATEALVFALDFPQASRTTRTYAISGEARRYNRESERKRKRESEIYYARSLSRAQASGFLTLFIALIDFRLSPSNALDVFGLKTSRRSVSLLQDASLVDEQNS